MNEIADLRHAHPDHERVRPVSAPTETATIFPPSPARRRRDGPHQSRTTRGSIAIPTDTKKIATNRSRTGTSAAQSPSTPTPTSDPAMNAPKYE
jgi:hypothetical protein